MDPPDPRVLFVSSHSADGGSEGHLRRLLRRLDPGSVAGVICLQEGPLVGHLRTDGWPVEVVATGSHPAAVLRSAAQLRRAVASARPDVIHANGVKAAIVAVLGRPKIPVVWNKHDHAYDGPIGRAVAARSAAVVGVSASALRRVRSAARRVVVLPPLVEAPVGNHQVGRDELVRLTGAERSRVIVCVGRLERAKGQLDVVSALAVLCAPPADLDVRLVLIGGAEPSQPDHAQQILNHVEALGLGAVVHFAGFRADAHDLIAGADALVVASHPVDRRGMGAEGYGLVAVEAMALGTPVVGYSAGALPEVLGDCGELVPVRDTAALADALRAVLTDQSRAERCVDCGRHQVHSVVDGTATLEGLQRIYREVSAGPSR